jgi:hypothetical protein
MIYLLVLLCFLQIVRPSGHTSLDHLKRIVGLIQPRADVDLAISLSSDNNVISLQQRMTTVDGVSTERACVRVDCRFNVAPAASVRPYSASDVHMTRNANYKMFSSSVASTSTFCSLSDAVAASEIQGGVTTNDGEGDEHTTVLPRNEIFTALKEEKMSQFPV